MKLKNNMSLTVVLGAAALILVNIGVFVSHLTMLMPILPGFLGVYAIAAKKYGILLSIVAYYLDFSPASLAVLAGLWVLSKAMKIFKGDKAPTCIPENTKG